MTDQMVQDRIDQLLPMVRRAEGSADDAVSPAGAIGRYQILPSTAMALGHDPSPSALKNPGYNEQVARSALADLIKQHGPNDTKAILAGYNASPGVVNQWKTSGRNDAVLPQETQDYFKRAGLPNQSPTLPYTPIKGPRGQQDYQKLVDSGVPVEQANAWRADQVAKLRQGGVPENKIADYFGSLPVEADLPPELPAKSKKSFIQNMMDGIGAADQGEAPSEFQQHVAKAGAESFADSFGDAPVLDASSPEGTFKAHDWLQKYYIEPTDKNLNGFNAITGMVANLGVPVVAAGVDAFNLAGRLMFAAIHGGVDAIAQVAKEAGADPWKANRFARDVKGGFDIELQRGGEVPAIAAAHDVTLAAGQIGGIQRMGHLVGPQRRLITSPVVDALTPNIQKIYEANGIHPAALAAAAGKDEAIKSEVISRMANGEMHTPTLDAEMPPKTAPEDTRGKGQQYHGSPQPLSGVSSSYYNEHNIYGATGFYTTDATDIAKGYQRKSSTGQTYAVNEVSPVKMFDMEEPHTPEEWTKLLPAMPQDEGLFALALESVGPKANLRQIMDEMRAESAGEGMSKIDTQEVFDHMTEQLHDQGFGGMQHVGGLITGKRPHQVKIYFRPGEQLRLEKPSPTPDEALKQRLDYVGEKNYEMPVEGETQGITGSFIGKHSGVSIQEAAILKKTLAGKVVEGGTKATVRSDAGIIGSYLQNFGKEGGFHFEVGSPEAMRATEFNSPHYWPGMKRVFIPETPEELNARWYGLSRYEIIHHEVGHAIDYANGNKLENAIRADMPSAMAMPGYKGNGIHAEALEASKAFRPFLHEQDVATGGTHTLKPAELAADSIAKYISDPSYRKNMPIFEKFYGDTLKPYMDAAGRALPTVHDGVWREAEEPPPGMHGGNSPPPPPPNGFSYTGAGPPPPPALPRPLGELEKEIDSAIGEKPDAKKPWWNPKVIYRQFVTELAKAPALDKELGTDPKLMGVEDQIRQTYASRGRTGYFVRYGTLKLGRNAAGEIVYNETGGPSIFAAFERARLDGGDQNGFIRYWTAARALMLDARGIEIPYGLRPEVARDYIGQTHQFYHDALKMTQENDFAVVDYGRDSGMFSAERAEAMKTLNPFHISFNRVIEPSYNPTGRAFGPKQPVKKIEGSDRQIIPPLQAKVENMNAIISQSDRNMGVGAVVDRYTALQSHLPSESRAVVLKETYNIPDIVRDTKIFDEEGNEVPPADKETLGPFVAMQKFFGSRGPNDFIYFRDGVPEIWTAQDPETALLLRSVQPGPETNFVTKIAEGFANISRLGIVSMPDFPVRTTVRSQFEAAIRSEHVGVPMSTFIHGFWDTVGQGEMFRKFMKDGGFGATIVDIDGKYLQRDIDAIFKKTGTWNQIYNVFRHPLDTLHAYRQMMENAPRLGYWKNAQDAGFSGPKAAMESRKAFGDNAERAGLSWVNTWAKTTMFMRPSVLDVHYLAQAMQVRPAHVLITGSTLVTLPTILNFFANKAYDKGKEDNIDYRMANPGYVPYSEMPHWQKDLMLVTPPVSGIRARLPTVPYTGGFLFHTLAERFLSYAWDHDPRASEDWGQSFMTQFAPPLIPALALPIYESATNSRQGSQAPLIPHTVEGLSGYMQVTPNTSNTAKTLSRVLGPIGANVLDVSALTLDNYIKDWAGGVGSATMRVLDGSLKDDPRPWELANTPFVGSFIARHPNMGSQPIEDFYRTLTAFETKHADLAHAIKTGDMSNLSAQMRVPGALFKYQQMDKLRTAISKQAQIIRAVEAKGDMTNAEKLKFSDSMFTSMVLSSKAGLRVLDSLQ